MWLEGQFTHGGNGFMKLVIETMLLGGWSLKEPITARPAEWANAAVTQSNTIPVSVPIGGVPAGTDIHLPICMIGSAQVRSDFGLGANPGVDFVMDHARGIVQILPGGIFVDPMTNQGWAGMNLTIDAGYNLMNGWIVFESSGLSTQETLYLGLRFDRRANGTATNPGKTGIRWTAFSQWNVGSTAYSNEVIQTRNTLADDVLQFLLPNVEGTAQASVNADRIICNGKTDSLSAWAYAGAMTRLRPVSEQSKIIAVAGNTAAADIDDGGIVGDTAEPGTMSAQMGSCFMYDIGQFSRAAQPVELNANHWTNTAGNSTGGYTPPYVILNAPPPGGAQQFYFELHDVIAGRNIGLINDVGNVLYGVLGGIKAVLCYGARHNFDLTQDSKTYRLWQVGSNPMRFVAVEKI